MINATKIAKELNSEAKIVNKALLALGFMDKVFNGYTNIHELGSTKEKNGNSFVIWKEEILDIDVFVDKVKELTKSVKEEIKEVSPKKENSKKEFLSATQIGKRLKIKASQVNSILVDIHYMDKLDKGYSSSHIFAKQLISNNEKTPYVKWEENLLEDEIFKREVKRAQENKVEFKKEISKEVEEKETTEKPFKFDRKTFDAQFRTQSGHFVRSRAEVIVADWLYTNDIMFAYEKRLPVVEELYSDFFIKEKKIYIEVWGLESTKYLERKAKKIEMYKEHGFTLIGLEDSDIENIDDFLPLKLAQAGLSF